MTALAGHLNQSHLICINVRNSLWRKLAITWHGVFIEPNRFLGNPRQNIIVALVHHRLLFAGRSFLMLPHQVFYLVPVLMLSLWFGSFYVNMRRAKKEVAHWKGYSTWLFFRSNGVAGIERRAKFVWMKEEGYDEAEARTIAKYQSRAVFCVVVGWFIVMVLAANIIER
jgi:hypothetical protein